MQKYSQDKVVLITGASSGLGKALAQEYAKNNSNVILLARRLDLISSTAEELSEKYKKCIAVQCDVTKDEDLEKAVKESLNIFKKIDIVIANAGFGLPGNIENLKIEDYKKQFEVNIFGVLRTIYATLPELKKTKGAICVIGSVNSIVSFSTGVSPYVMSKFALRGLIKSLHLEMMPYNISITHIMPGFIKTDFDKNKKIEEKEKYNWLKMEPEKAAKLIIKAIKHKKREVVLTVHGKIAVYLERHFPFILRKISKLFSKTKHNVRT